MIIALAGRLIDQPGSRKIRFPAEMTGAVRDRILECLRDENASVLVSSAACGADLLAQDAARELDIERHVILPFDHRRFRITSVVRCPGDWGRLYDDLCDSARRAGNLVTLEDETDEAQAYAAATIEILDHAQAIKEQEIAAVIVWEGSSREKEDESSTFKNEAVRRNIRVIEISTLP